MNIFVLIFIGLVGVAFGVYIGRRSVRKFNPADKEELSELRSEAHRALGERTQMRKEKILEYMKKEARHQSELRVCGIDFSRDEFDRRDVERLLDVSEKTALKYLNELESEGKIQQVGERGQGVYYKLV